MTPERSPRRRLRVGVWSLLALVAVVALGLGLVTEHRRRERVRETLAQPILDAAGRGDAHAVRVLLDRGANADSITNGRFPWTPLMEAGFRGHLAAVRLLLDRGADPDHEDLDAFTAATVAAHGEHWEVVVLLAERGADLNRSDGSGKTAMDYAREAGKAELAAYLATVAAESKRGRRRRVASGGANSV